MFKNDTPSEEVGDLDVYVGLCSLRLIAPFPCEVVGLGVCVGLHSLHLLAPFSNSLSPCEGVGELGVYVGLYNLRVPTPFPCKGNWVVGVVILDRRYEGVVEGVWGLDLLGSDSRLRLLAPFLYSM